jgi:hypothetical protein
MRATLTFIIACPSLIVAFLIVIILLVSTPKLRRLHSGRLQLPFAERFQPLKPNQPVDGIFIST